VSYDPVPRLRVKGRLELTDVGYPLSGRKERGCLLLQDFQLTVTERLSVGGRLVFYQSDSYDSRLYEYETDLRGVFSNPGLYGEGERWYLVTRYALDKTIILSAKYAETRKEGVSTIGSGMNEIRADVDNRLALQLDVTL